VAEQVVSTLAVDDPATLRDVPIAAIVNASFRAFSAVPSQTPGTLAFAPTVDGEVLPDYPVRAAREGRTHPVPLIIGTNKDEAALFRLIKSPLLPMTAPAIRAMFAEIANEQPGLLLPTEADVRLAYSGLRPRAIGAAVARDVAFRMPTVWYAEGHSQVAPVYLYRFDWATRFLRLLRIGATHGTELPYVFGNLVLGPRDPTFKLGGLKQGRELSRRLQSRWVAFATTGVPTSGRQDVSWRPYRPDDRATMVFDRTDTVVGDLDDQLRQTWGEEVLSFQ
jgi:para-nitrobenzyl esterase